MRQSRPTVRPLIGVFLLTRARCRLSMCVPWPLGRPCSQKLLLVRSLPAALLQHLTRRRMPVQYGGHCASSVRLPLTRPDQCTVR